MKYFVQEKKEHEHNFGHHLRSFAITHNIVLISLKKYFGTLASGRKLCFHGTYLPVCCIRFFFFFFMLFNLIDCYVVEMHRE